MFSFSLYCIYKCYALDTFVRLIKVRDLIARVFLKVTDEKLNVYNLQLCDIAQERWFDICLITRRESATLFD